MTSNSTHAALVGACLPPFLDVTKFPKSGGFIDGRLCAPMLPGVPSSPICCLPCPVTDWIYPDDFHEYNTVAAWLNVAGIVLLSFMLLSYCTLPKQHTRSHYLSICLVVSVMMIAIGFTIPLATQPDQCYNEITPHDMYSSLECAWSGAFIIAGGLSVVAWILLRALSMNLQICFDIVPGKRFFYAAQALGWGVPAVLFAATMTFTGVSFRFGNACHVNHANSVLDFWGPLLVMAGAAGILQFATFAYCIKVYLKNLWADEAKRRSTQEPTTLPTYKTRIVRIQAARIVWRRLQKVLSMQWRGLTIVVIILVNVVFFSIVFLCMDSTQNSIMKDEQKIMPWVLCLATHPDNKDRCLHLAQHWLVDKSMVLAVLMMLSLGGLELFIFLTRPSIFSAWIELLRDGIGRGQSFIPLSRTMRDHQHSDSALTLSRKGSAGESTNVELGEIVDKTSLTSLSEHKEVVSSPVSAVTTPSTTYHSPLLKSHPSHPFSPADVFASQPYWQTPPANLQLEDLVSTTHGAKVNDHSDYFPQRTIRRSLTGNGALTASSLHDTHRSRRRRNGSESCVLAVRYPERSSSLHARTRGHTGQTAFGHRRTQTRAEIREARQAREEEELASWRQHDLWARDDRFKR